MTKKIVSPPTQDRIIEEQLTVELTPAEHTERAEALAKLDIEINWQKEAARECAGNYREAIKILVEKRDALAVVVDTHKEVRNVECVEVIDFARNTVVLTRRDNGAHVSERPMDGEERAKLAQGEMLNGQTEAPA